MIKNILRKNLFVITFLFSINTFSQYYKLSPETKVSVLTCGSGNELYSIYGHTAIRFQDPKNNLDVVVNYGNFDFRTTNFYGKFVKGDLQYFVAASTFSDFMLEYIETNRNVYEQILVLTEIQKQKLFDEINTSMYSDERFYTYKFIDKNCTTMVLDKVNALFGKNVVFKKSNTDISYRKVLYSYLGNHFFENLGINVIFGYKTDANATKLFLPNELKENLEVAKFQNKLIAQKPTILHSKNLDLEKFSWWNNIYFFTAFFILILVLNKKSLNIFYLITLGLIGIFLSLVGFYSLHNEVTQNYNVFLFNPSLILLVYFLYKQYHNWILRLCYFNLICVSIHFFIILNKVDLIMLLPVQITSVVILIKLILNQRKKLLPSIK